MKNTEKDQSICSPGIRTCCKVQAIISVDTRGQVVLPKGLRVKAAIHVGDKLVITSWEKDGTILCMSLIKAGDINNMVKETFGPVIKETLAQKAK
jgi:bifunctional DNA-binding transcriptional regulator/antitoxin component of YhaV-PrlF toxin-antitoxin module